MFPEQEHLLLEHVYNAWCVFFGDGMVTPHVVAWDAMSNIFWKPGFLNAWIG